MVTTTIVVSVVLVARTPSGVARVDRDFTRVVSAGSRADRPTRRQCRSARHAVAYYAAVIDAWNAKTGDTRRMSKSRRLTTCPLYLAVVLRHKALETRSRVRVWLREQYAWRLWLPDKWARVGACETGYGRRPGSFSWDSGRYVSAFGIYRPAYDQHAGYIGQRGWDQTRYDLGRLPTPREQFNVALEIRRRYGFGAWGCGGA